VLFTWPLAANAREFVLRAIFHWDAYTNAMIMGSRVDAALGRAPMTLHDTYYFAPLRNSIVFNENHFGLSLIFAPFYLISGKPLLAYNLTLLVSLTLSAFFTYLLVRKLTGSGWAGIIAGVAFAYSPYALFEMGRIQLVATQWIPLSFLLLHRAIETQRPRDGVAFWCAILLQIGTCLYYAMFLVPLLSLLGCVLISRQRPAPRFFAWFGAAAAGAGLVALWMVFPYFSARPAFNLERSLSVASSNDGKFGFFANVHPTNYTLTGLHHVVASGAAHDEIAFPGFTATALLVVGLAVPAVNALSRADRSKVLADVGRWIAIALGAFVISILTHSLLLGTLAIGGGIWFLARNGSALPFGGDRGAYLGVLLVALSMFLGIHPFDWDGEPVRGLYYYFHTYFPGFNGIRKVGRQAVMTTFVIVVLAGFGGSWIFARLRGLRDRLALTAVLLGLLAYELRCFPHPLERVWGAAQPPSVLRFVASLPAEDMLAFTPQNTGRAIFRGDDGMALYNYLALHHKHRFVNGQSSWQPPVTELARRSVERLPDDAARRALLSMGARHIVILEEDLPPERAGLAEKLAARPEEYQRIFQEGSHSVFTLREKDTRSLDLLPTPPLPDGARLIPQAELRARASLRPDRANLTLDGDPDTYWTGGRFQAPDQYFEVDLSSPRAVAALELTAAARVMDLPASFRLTAHNGAQDLGVVEQRPLLRLHREQIFEPKKFVLRIVLAQPTTLDRLRLTIIQPVPGSYFSIHELRAYGPAQ